MLFSTKSSLFEQALRPYPVVKSLSAYLGTIDVAKLRMVSRSFAEAFSSNVFRYMRGLPFYSLLCQDINGFREMLRCHNGIVSGPIVSSYLGICNSLSKDIDLFIGYESYGDVHDRLSGSLGFEFLGSSEEFVTPV